MVFLQEAAKSNARSDVRRASYMTSLIKLIISRHTRISTTPYRYQDFAYPSFGMPCIPLQEMQSLPRLSQFLVNLSFNLNLNLELIHASHELRPIAKDATPSDRVFCDRGGRIIEETGWGKSSLNY